MCICSKFLGELGPMYMWSDSSVLHDGGETIFSDPELMWQLSHYGRAPAPAFILAPDNIAQVGTLGTIYKIQPFFGGNLTYGKS